MPNYEFHIFITRCKSYRRPKTIHYVSHENERVILLVFQLLYLNNELTDPIFLFHFLKEHRCRLHYILFFPFVNYFKFGISHQRTTLTIQIWLKKMDIRPDSVHTCYSIFSCKHGENCEIFSCKDIYLNCKLTDFSHTKLGDNLHEWLLIIFHIHVYMTL